MAKPPATPSAATPLALDVRGLRKVYRPGGGVTHRVEVLRKIDLQVKAGEWVTLMGKSGSGKSTLLHLLGTLDRVDEGELYSFGTDLRRLGFLGRARFRRTVLGFIFQSYHLFPELDALENIMLAGRVGGVFGTKDCRERASELLTRVGLADRADHRPAELSGGEQQRVAIARALMNRPQLLLADEPTGNLDATNAAAIMELLRDLRAREPFTVVMVTHDIRLAPLADRTFAIRDGMLVAAGK